MLKWPKKFHGILQTLRPAAHFECALRRRRKILPADATLATRCNARIFGTAQRSAFIKLP
jgi:hypothetical protein